MRVADVMSPAKCCSPDDTVQRCAKLMKDENIGFVPVCDQGGKPLGAVTDRDLAIRVLAEGKGGNEKIDRFVTRDIVSCRTGDDIQDAARLMAEHQVSRVMVCDQSGKLQGVISLQDLAEEESDETAGRTLTEVKSDQPTAH